MSKPRNSPALAGPVRITNTSTQGRLVAARHIPPTYIRPGADQGLALPSRFGDQLHYRDGRVSPFHTANQSS